MDAFGYNDNDNNNEEEQDRDEKGDEDEDGEGDGDGDGDGDEDEEGDGDDAGKKDDEKLLLCLGGVRICTYYYSFVNVEGNVKVHPGEMPGFHMQGTPAAQLSTLFRLRPPGEPSRVGIRRGRHQVRCAPFLFQTA